MPAQEREKKKKNSQCQPRKKKVKRWSKVAAVGPLCVFNYNIVIELWVMETELLFAKQTFCYGSYYFWVMSYENRELSYQN